MTQSTNEQIQAVHYDALVNLYEAHYGDPTSRAYRDHFIHAPLFDSISFEGLQVLDAMCGSGQVTEYLLSHGARVTGLDISENSIKRYREKFPSAQPVVASILNTGLPDAAFDHVTIVGGLHHLHPHVDAAVTEITRLLKPGGSLFFVEAYVGSFQNFIRRQWYGSDPMFETNEAAIDFDALYQRHNKHLEWLALKYGGGMAYQFVLNSMVWRIPVSWKPHYAPFLMGLEKRTGFLFQFKFTGSFAMGRWRKR